MAESDPGDRLVPATDQGALRASHADRDRVVELLRVAAGDGRLSAEELDERLDLALTARTYAELAALVTDLPAAGAAGSPAAAEPPREVIRIHTSSGRAGRNGRWLVPSRMDLNATSGQITLDFTDAVITQPALHIDAEIRSGQLTLITKPGIAVDADDVTVRSGEVKVRAPWGPDVPVLLRISIAGTCGSGRITARPPRRGFWQWLLRKPRYAITQ